MKIGRSLQSLAAELERQTQTRKDYIAPQGKVQAVVVSPESIDGTGPAAGVLDVQLAGFNGDSMPFTPYAHRQMSDHLGIPAKYYDRMQAEQPHLLATNINAWLHADPDNRRMLRTLDGRVRAVLSPKFRPLDNFDLANALLPTLIEKRVEVMSCELTQTRLYIKGILPTLSDELPAGMAFGTGHDRVGTLDRGRIVSAIVVSNSEVGDGTLRIEPSVFTTWCTNLAILAKAAMKQYHVGRANTADGSWEVFQDATRRADDAAFWMKVRDVSMAAFDERIFRAAIAELRAAADRPIKSDNLQIVVERAVVELSLPPSTSAGILKHLAAGGDLTQWGLSSAITRVANDADDYEAATSLERAGGAVIALPATNWQRIAEAA